jgi:hypothetical protein
MHAAVVVFAQIVGVVVSVLAIVAAMYFMKPKPPPAVVAAPAPAPAKAGKGKGGATGDATGGGKAGAGHSISHLLKAQSKRKAVTPSHPLFIRSVKSAGGDATCFGMRDVHQRTVNLLFVEVATYCCACRGGR